MAWLDDIIQLNLTDDQFYKEENEKKQIVLHHTVSGPSAENVISYWQDNQERVATAILIDRRGKIYQCFSSKYWGHHLGIKETFLKKQGFSDYKSRNILLNKQSIAIEIISWGGLVKSNDKYYPAIWDKGKYVANTKVKPIPLSEVFISETPFRDFKYFQKYTDKQIESVKNLLILWNQKYNIPLTYNNTMWNVSKDALNGNSGVWTHVSYREDKSDCFMQEELITMLKTL